MFLASGQGVLGSRRPEVGETPTGTSIASDERHLLREESKFGTEREAICTGMRLLR